MDNIAINCDNITHNLLPKIKEDKGYINLSGIETSCQRLIGNEDDDTLIEALFYRLCQSVISIVKFLNKEYNIENFIFAGGVSSSKYFRKEVKHSLDHKINIIFGDPFLSTDNAVGVALLGGKKYGN